MCERTGKDPNDGKSIRSQLGVALHLIRFPAMSIKEIAEFVGPLFLYVSHFVAFYSFESDLCLVPTGILNWEEQRDVLFVIGGANPLGPLISTKAIPRKRIYLNTNIFTIY